MKPFLISAASLGVSTSAALAAGVTYVTDFEPPTWNDPVGEVAGTDGWMIDNPKADISFVVSSWDMDGPGGNPGTQAAALGGFFDSPGQAETNLTRPVSITLSKVDFDVDFSVMAFTPGGPAPFQDAVGFSFYDGTASPALRIAFEPPGGTGDLEIAWYDNTGSRNLLTPVSQDIFYDGTYHLAVDFAPNGGDVDFTATLSGIGSATFGGTLTGTGSELSAIGLDFDLVGDGDSYLVIDNLSVVPEPHSALMAIAGAAALALRRRR